MGGTSRATRTTVIVAMILTVLMVGLPSFQVADHNVSPSLADQAAATAGDRSLRVSVIALTSSIATLNPLKYTMAQEMDVIWPCYSTLLQYDPDKTAIGAPATANNRIGDIATAWDTSPDGLTYHFRLSQFAKFYNRLDPTGNHPVTARDVIYTFWLIQNTTSNLASYFPILNHIKTIKSMTMSGPYDVYITTNFPYAPFISAMTSIPILPAYIWNDMGYAPWTKADFGGAGASGWGWVNYDIHAGVAPCVGSGPFYYTLDGAPTTGGIVELNRNNNWFQTEERGWQLHINKLVWRDEASDVSNLADFQSGVIDVMQYVTPDNYLNTLPPVPLPGNYYTTKWSQSTGFVYEFNLNQMTDKMRSDLGGKYKLGTNNQLLLDPTVKLAIAMAVDKQAWVTQVLKGLGTTADSLAPSVNPGHYTYGSTPGDQLVVPNIAAARTMLNTAGWTYDLAGNFNPAATPLCKAPATVGGVGTSPLQFRFWTMNTAPQWDEGARLLATWEQAAGIDLWYDYAAKSSNQMNGAWMAADYDMWLWDWVFTPTSEISTDIMQVCTSDAIGTWSDVFWSNPTYDSIYNQSLTTVDVAARRALTDELQRIIYEDHACQLIAYRNDMYAASSHGPDQWTNWGNWATKWLLMPDQLAPWLYMQIEPRDNPAPHFSSFTKTYPDAQVNVAVSMSGSVTDTQALSYRWFYGDGTRDAGWTNTLTGTTPTTHTYLNDGIYTAYLAVRENSGADAFISWNSTTVTVSNWNNKPPSTPTFTYWSKLSPGNPDTGSIVYLNASSTDPDAADTLFYNWNFGDGHTAMGQNVTHQFEEGSSTVTVSVSDNHIGNPSEPRPVSTSSLIIVSTNSPPSISVPDVTGPRPKAAWDYWVTTRDSDTLDNHRYTWVWGDGSVTVTTAAPLPNETIMATHTYALGGTFTMRVYADDLTGLTNPPHNVSDTGQVLVRRGTNLAPVISSFTVSKNNPVRFETVTFTGVASEPDADDMTWTWDFGDGTSTTISVPVKNANAVTKTITHEYTTAANRNAYLYVSDGWANTTSSRVALVIAVGDHEPVITPLGQLNLTIGLDHTFTATATDVDPGDQAALTYYWQFGDGVNMSGQTVVKRFNAATGPSGTWYKVWVNDHNTTYVNGPMNVSAGNTVRVNSVPWIVNPLPSMVVNASATASFSVTAWDNDTLDNGTLRFTWDFGDGSKTVVTGDSSDPNPIVMHTYPSLSVYTYRVYVDDLYADTDLVSHNVTRSATISLELTVTLVKGWNFVSVPLVGYGYTANSLGLLAGDLVSGWNPTTQRYDQNYIVGAPRNNFAINTTSGYWIYAGAAEVLHMHGAFATGVQSRPITVPATGGWVIIGFNSFASGRVAENVGAMYTGGSVLSVVKYVPTTGAYISHIIPSTRNNFALTPGEAYWIWVTASGTLSYTA